MADKDNKSKLTYHVWDKDNNEYDIPDEVVQQRGMDNFAKDFEGGYITMFDDKKQKVDVPIEDVGEYRKQGYMWYDTSGNATPINEVGKKPSPSKEKEQSQYPQEVKRGELKKPSLISQALGMMPKVDAGNIGREQKVGGMIANMLLGDNMQVQQPAQKEASPESKEAAPVTTPTGVVNNEGLMDAKLANYIENWKQRPDKQSTYFENMVADLLADGTANSNEEAVNMVLPALHRYANRSAMDVTNQVVSSLPDDTVQDAEKSIGAQWYSHGVQDKLKQEADSMGISYDDYVALFLKPAMVQSLVNKYGPNYRNIAEGIATRLYAHDENVQDRLMKQDIDEALLSVISKYVNPSVVEEYNKAQEEGSKAFNEGMEGSQYIPANLRLGTALGAQYEANEAKDPAKVLSGLQQKFGKLYRNPKFLNDMSNAAFKVMQRYGLNGTLSGNPKQFKPMINAAIKNELDQLEIKGMMPKGSAEYIMKTGLGNTIVGKITRKIMQTDYQNWLEDIANQQYQPGFWENVASGALTFAGDAWSYWLPGAAGGKLTKSMVAKAEGKLAGDLMAKGMERRVAERAAKVLIGKSKAAALKSGAVHGAVTFGGQSAISKPIDEVYRTGQFDENGMIYNPSVGKVIANTLGEVAKQSAVGAIMQGGTIANMVGKGRGLATNILADIGGKVADSGIMTGHQMLERMAQDPNFKPTGKDAAESFLESMANLTAIGLPGMVGKYARFKDAREFNKKFDFTDQDIAELKRFGYDGLRDAFEKMGIGEYAVVGENAQRLDGQLTQKYMDLMNDKSVPEVLKAKMMAVVEGKRPSSFSPVVDSIIVQPMDHDGKVYLETLNKDGGIIDRKEFSSLDEAQKADKKLEYEKTLGLASVLEGEFHNEFTQEHLEGLYNKAAQKYNMGEKLTDEDKAAVYLHQNAGAIKDIMDKQQKGIILTDEEQKQINAYRHYYDSALENSSVMREFVNTFEDSHGVARGTLRKALESKDKKYAPLVESYLKELYNSIELKREMKQTMDDLYNTAHGNEQKRIEQGGVEGEKPTAPVEGSAGGQEPPVSEGPSLYQGNVSSGQGEGVSIANLDNSSADVITSDAFVMGQNAYKNGDSEALQAIGYNSDLATGRLKRAFADNEKMPNIVANAYNEGRDMEQFVAQRASSLTPAQKEAISKYVEAMDAKKGAIDALQHADDGYGEALKQQLWPYQTVDGNIVPATLDSGKQVFLKKANEYGGAFVVVPDEHGQPMIKQVSNAEIKEVGSPVSLDEYIESSLAQQKEARAQQFISQFDGSGLKQNDRVTVAMEEGDANIDMTFAGYSEDGKIVLTDGKDYLPLSKEEFAAWRKNALDNTINEHLDAEDDEREQKAVSQAEADKKQRYANGIVGLSEGQPDYSSKDSDPNVAAEYLQEQFGEDHGKLLNLIDGSRDDIKTQLDNKKKAATEAYLANYSKGWKGLGKVTGVPKTTFDKWLESSDRKTKPFADYAMVQKEQAKFDRDVKEVKPSEMTEAQKVAYDAVSTMLKKAGIPVKVVSNEDMEKVAEAQDNSLFAKYKDFDRQLKAIVQPGVRFLRTYHGTGASFDKFDFSHMGEGEGSQAFGWGGYVTNSKDIAEDYTRRAKIRKDNGGFEFVTDMSANNKDLVRKYIYKHKDVNKGLDAMRKDLSSALEMFPDDDDLKELSNILAKKNEEIAVPDNIAYLYDVDIPDDNGDYLDWDAPLTDKQKNTIIKELRRLKIDFADFKKRGFSFDGSFGDNAYGFLMYALRRTKKWKDVDASRAVSKFLFSIGFTGIKYKAGTIFGGAKEGDYNYVIFDENNVNIVGNTKFAHGKGVVYGYTDGKEIVLNQEHLNPNTPIHEYQHLWRTAAKNMNPELIEHGDKLIMQTQLFADLKQDPNYNHLTDEQICDEAFARLTGEDGAAILEQMAKDAIKENPLDTAKELSVINKLKEWLKKFWYWALDTFTKWNPEDIKKMTLEDIRNLVLRDLANGVDPRNVKFRMTKEDAVSLRKQMADNAEQERILEHTEENWLKEFGKDSRVTTPIGSIKLGENQYKKAGRNDRIKRFGLLKPTLERPDVILEKSAPKEGAERQTKYLFIKSFKKADGNKILNYESITVKQGEEEVAISAHQIDPSKVLKELTESKVLWNRFRGDSNSLGENQGSALTPSANNPSGKDSVLNPHSDANIRNNIETTKGNGGKLSVEDKIKAVSQQFGVDEADVAMYANAVKKGSTAEAARARANIKRHLLQANEDKISSLKELLKYTVPVNNALKENFGDLDAMIEERVKQVEAQRNAMEAARKRAEEEEAKRQKHLEELSVIPDDQLDKQYMDALAKGDDATAREMLDEAARRKGYDDTESAYQGVGAWAAPGNPGYESDKARRDDWESSGSDVNLEDIALGYAPQPDDYFSHPERYSQNTPHGLESVKAINTAIDAIKNGEKDVNVKVYRAVPTSVKEGKLRNGDWVTPSKKYAEMHGTNRLEGKYRIIEDEVPATQLWWDGNDANEFGFDDGKEYKYKNAKNNRKLNDLVTYDDEGDVIPPSKRFNSRKSDIRFMFAGEKGAAEADKADEQTIRMDNLDVAKQMEDEKKDAKIIKMATGWEKGVDGKWRYEMQDAKIKDTIDVGGGNIVKRFEEDMLWTDGKLEDAVDAPKLFEAYPQLKNIKIHTDAVMNDMPSNGEYNPQTKTITIHADELKYLNSILNHEIQHVIQREEGFAHGGTPEQVERDFNAAKAEWKARSYAFELEEKAKEMGGEYNQSAVEKALIQEYKDMDMPEFIPDKETRIKGFNYFARGYADRSMDDAIKRFRLDRFQRTDFDSYQEYRKLAGEVESRNVEKRLGMTDEERRNSLASETEDVNRDEQIVMNGNDASYSIVKDPETIKKLDKEDTVKVYRAMQVGEDGKLYPPMAAKVKGKFVEPIELGKWEQADERPELADDKGMFTLNKGNGKSLKAAYNPYLHTSRTPLNDQFSEAQNRPNIVTVEVEVPKSELTSGYKADKAKDAVGEVEWKAGIIQGQLTGKRKVVLSRWDKPVRIVPDSEVADVIVNDMFKGKNITMPSNVVTPSLRKELEKRGVPFVETDNRGRIVGGENDGVHYSKVYGKNAQSPVLEQKLKKHPDSLMKAGTYFSGGGLVEEGLKGIIDPVVAVEYDRKISGVYRNNFGQHIVTADVRDVDPKELVKHIDGEVEYFHASPVCKNYSQAKSNSGEVELDKETAKSTADFIDAVKPRVVTIENVKGYKDSEAMKIITKALDKNGYTWDSDVYNAADYGGYTSRERLIVRAVKDGELPEKPKKQPRKGGWLEAVKDILPTLTVKESGVAPWMDARLKVDGIDWKKVEKPLYVMGSAYADGKIPHAYGDEILPTLRTKSGDVIIMPGGKVLRADGRVLARITGLGDDYKLPKTESLAHTIIGNGIPVQLTQGVIAPLLNKDDLSGRNVLARLGSSIFKNNWDADKQKQVSDRVVNTANKLGGAEATVYTSVDEVPDAYLSDVKNGATGWYDPTTHTVHVYLPNCADANEAERTVLHEKIGHEGMEVLLGGEDGVRKFANFVYRSASKDVRGKIIDFANKYDPDWKNPDRMNVGTQEYIAHLAEEGPKTAEDFSLWTKIKHYLIKVLKKLGVRVPGLLNDKDLRYYLMKAGKALHVWDNMPKEKQEAMMKQASNAEIKDALSDGAGKGKPRQKKGESTIQYMKRVQEWRKWKNAREDENDPEPPMFYDFDKDEAGKKEWAQLNKDWRERHHLVGEEPTGMPIRMENEDDDAYMNRIHEYEKWQAAMKEQEDPMPDMFAFEKKKQEEVKRKYEDWLAKHDLLEQQQADLDLYEGKIYPAETNPKADALEQQVMQDLAEVTSTDVSKEGAAKTVKHAVIHRRKNMEEASADDAIYINDVKNRIEKMADSGAFDKLLSDYKGKPNKAEKLAEAIPYIIEAHRRLRDLAHDLNATDAFDKGHIHIQPDDVEAIQPFVADLIAETAKMHTVLKDDKEVKVYDDPQAVSEVANKLAQAINANHQGEEGFVPIDGTDILSKHVLPLVKQQIVPVGIDYKNLSPEMKAAIDSIRDWYNYTYDWLKDNHTLREDTGYNADYVNHIWDKEKSDKQAYAMYVENRQRTKSPNEKPRTISTLMEGISVGLVPKTTDITKMMAYYSRSNIEAWVNKTMLQELSGLNVIERNEDGEIVSSDPLLSSTPPFNLEQYKYFEIPGVGPVWVYNVSPKQMKVKNPITGKEKVLYSEASAGDRFGVVFETFQSSPFWKAFDTLASSAKKLELGFSGFHAGALTEVYMVQNMVEFGPKKAMANFMKYIFVDTAKNHELPCFANPEDFQEAASHLVKFGATNDYAAADVQNMFDNMRDAMIKVQEKLKDGNGISGTVALATMPLKVATQMLSLINKGMDRALWDFLHDGLKLATYRMRADKTKERAKKKGWTEEELSRALDEDGQFVNDMFGGQHWDILGASHRTLRYAGRVLLSPDWNASTTRHFLALTGYGSIWNEATFENFKQYYQRLKHKELIPEDEGRKSRQISALLCYGIGFMVFYEGIANGINAAFRALDEEKERKKAEEIRKTNPSYKSMYELAYGDEGMKWYDYLMRGNSLGQQSKIYLGRYADGTEMYIRHGKQFREVPEYLFNHKGELEFPGPMVQRMIGKANPMVRMTLDNINYLSDFQASHADEEIQRKYGKTIGLLYKDALYWAPFLIPSQENKEFKAVDFFFPSSKGFSPWKAQSYFKDFILSGDMEGVVMTYQSCQRNGIDPEAQIKAAIGSVKALESAEMQDGVTSLQEASKRFDAAKSITEKKKMRQKIKKFLSQSEYKAFTQKEALDMVQGYLNGDEDLKEMEKAESKYLMKAKAEDVREDWRIQNVWNGTMETYQEYQRLKDVDKAKANAFKNSKTNKRLFAARKAISAAKKKMNKAKKQMDGQNDAAKLVEIRKTRKELLKTLNGME